MKILRKILKILLILIILLILGFAGIIVYALITDYKPEIKVELYESDKPDKLSDTSEVSLLTWNIGYCGLDKEMDFF